MTMTTFMFPYTAIGCGLVAGAAQHRRKSKVSSPSLLKGAKAFMWQLWTSFYHY